MCVPLIWSLLHIQNTTSYKAKLANSTSDLKMKVFMCRDVYCWNSLYKVLPILKQLSGTQPVLERLLLCWSLSWHQCHLLWGQLVFRWQNSVLDMARFAVVVITSKFFSHGIMWTCILKLSVFFPEDEIFPQFFFFLPRITKKFALI